MIIAGETQSGIELKIFELQNVLDNVLCNTVDARFNWLGQVNIYGKIHTLMRDNLTIPQVYIGNSEYFQPFLDDRNAASIGFKVNQLGLQGRIAIADLDLISTVNLFTIWGANSERNTSKALLNVYDALQGHVYTLGNIKEKIDDVFKDYTGRKFFQPIDISQWYVFSINFKVFFDNKLN